MTQLDLDFSTASPINKEKLSGQNERLYNYLKEGNTIHCFSPAMQRLKIGYLNSRCSDLINKHNITIFKRWIQGKGQRRRHIISSRIFTNSI